MLNDENQPSIVTTAPVTNCDAKEQIVAGLTDLLKYKGITIKEKKDDRIHVFITLALKRKKATPCLTKNHRKLLVQSLFV